MKNSTKIWLVIASLLIVAGCVTFAVSMSMNDWNFSALSTVKYDTSIHEINDDFDYISISTDTADIVFAVSDNDKCIVECFEDVNAKHTVKAEDDTLTINVIDEKAWYDYIGVDFSSPTITVYLPKTEYATLSVIESTGDITIPKDFKFKSVDISASTGDIESCASSSDLLKIHTSTGDICVESASVGSLDLSVTTGTVYLDDVSCKNSLSIKVSTGISSVNNVECTTLNSSGDTGDIILNNVTANDELNIKRTTGNVSFNNSDACEIFVETDTGDVTGTLLSDKVFITRTDTGDIDVPDSVTGGKCEVSTNTGDIKFTTTK